MDKSQFIESANEVSKNFSNQLYQAENALRIFCTKNRDCLIIPTIVFRDTGLNSSQYRQLVREDIEESKNQEFQILLKNLISVEEAHKIEVRNFLIKLKELKEFDFLIRNKPQIFMYPSLEKYLEALEEKTAYEAFGLIRNIRFKLGW